MEAVCPNCGNLFVDYRTDRQSTGGREVILSWMLCTTCRHVGLKKWMIVHPENPKPQAIAGPIVDDSARPCGTRVR